MNSTLKNATLSNIYHFDLETYHRLSHSGYLPPNTILRQVSPLSISELNSEPEPDLAIVNGNEDDYTDIHPNTALWVIEISNSSLHLDRKKINSYAKAGISVYWIIDLVNSQIEVYSNLSQGQYLDKKNYSRQDNVDLPVVGGQIFLNELV